MKHSFFERRENWFHSVSRHIPTWRLETDAADVKIFLEAIEWEELGEFQCTDISA
jgi:hypothetical protein